MHCESIDDSVNADIIISSEWLNSTGSITTGSTISSISESISHLEQRHNLIFRPLLSEDKGVYTCIAAIIVPHSNDKPVALSLLTLQQQSE